MKFFTGKENRNNQREKEIKTDNGSGTVLKAGGIQILEKIKISLHKKKKIETKHNLVLRQKKRKKKT